MKRIKKFEELFENLGTNICYHGTPDSREVDENGFVSKNTSIEYIADIEIYNDIQTKLSNARETDMNLYHELLNKFFSS